MKTVCVIDMQDHFAERENKSFSSFGYATKFKNTKRLLNTAVKQGWNVILVEFAYKGPTNGELLTVLEGYDKVYRAVKDCDDGSYQIVNVLKKHNIETSELIIAGANTEACVHSTVRGLLRLLGHGLPSCPVTVCIPAVMSFNARYTKYGADYIRKHFPHQVNKVESIPELTSPFEADNTSILQKIISRFS